MKKGNLPTQEYELINVCMQTVESGTPLTCMEKHFVLNWKAKTDGKEDTPPQCH